MQAQSEGEKKLAEILKQSFSASQIAVKDISGQYGLYYLKSALYIPLVIHDCNVQRRSQFMFFYAGGCGAMYEIFVESEDFRGKRQVQQHRLVNKVCIN